MNRRAFLACLGAALEGGYAAVSSTDLCVRLCFPADLAAARTLRPELTQCRLAGADEISA